MTTDARKRKPTIKVALDAMDTATLECRDFGHSWRAYTASWLKSERCYESRIVCARCGTFRVRRLTTAGAVLSTHYAYPEGYLVKGLGRLVGDDRNVLRVESLLRHLGDGEAWHAE